MFRQVLHRLAASLGEPRVIHGREDGTDPYLSRWYFFKDRRPDDPQIEGQRAGGSDSLNLYLHRFHRSDDDQALHSHPWKWSASLVLAGGYIEERRQGDRVIRRTVRPGQINVIPAGTYHRVDLLEHDCWSLFVAGPQTADSWRFWDRVHGRSMPWRDFIRHVHNQGPPLWQSDRREPELWVQHDGLCKVHRYTASGEHGAMRYTKVLASGAEIQLLDRGSYVEYRPSRHENWRWHPERSLLAAAAQCELQAVRGTQ